MGVIPVGSTLADGKLVGEGGASLDRREAHVRNAVHVGRYENAVPMDGGLDGHLVVKVYASEVTFLKVQSRPGNVSVNCHCQDGPSRDVYLSLGDHKIIFDSCSLCIIAKEKKEDQSSTKCKNASRYYISPPIFRHFYLH